MYLLLSGKPAFDGVDDKEIIKKVKKGEVFLNSHEWKKISKEAIDLVKRMLTKDPDKRISADDALQHPYLRKFRSNKASRADVKKALRQLRQFKIYGKLQQAAVTYICSQLLGKDDIDNLREVFNKLDVSCNGMITRDELLLCFRQYLKKEAISEKDLDDVLALIDQDLSGQISFSEFLAATVNPMDILTDQRLTECFQMFDKDRSGSISPDEVKVALCAGKNIDDKVWKQVIQQVDQNRDSEISCSEFIQMMRSIFE
eukprot:CAMPEP_0170560682 /NCGR_PEP_ID=MMETSP0211-20121228/50329_1 /TAXON_ID=311385 /ORGANISM="Pseudokeronopsis sp., Strain OXSARD2" /LENGTH=257 /DNA_ID=CAMNT_0010875187 /DNA_START=592 /DNA_END=1362 /DNA_ORIENTATION=-